jgi:hypothetical protein
MYFVDLSKMGPYRPSIQSIAVDRSGWTFFMYPSLVIHNPVVVCYRSKYFSRVMFVCTYVGSWLAGMMGITESPLEPFFHLILEDQLLILSAREAKLQHTQRLMMALYILFFLWLHVYILFQRESMDPQTHTGSLY